MPVNNACVCDSNSSLINGKCTYITGGWSIVEKNGFKYCFKTISNNCNDWRDSVIIPFTDGTFQAGVHNLTGGISNFKGLGGGWISVDYYKELANYDTLASNTYFNMSNGETKTVAFYWRITKNRDSIYATICNTQWMPVYKRLDTCHSILVRAI